MPDKFTEARHPAEFVLSEANGKRSRGQVTVAAAQDLPPGTIFQLAAGKAVGFGGDSDDTVAGILLYPADTTVAEVDVATLVRDAEVNSAILSVPEDDSDGTVLAAGIAQLAALGIIAR